MTPSQPVPGDIVERLHASAAETRVKVAIVQSDPMIFPPLLDEMLRSADSVDEAAAEITRLRRGECICTKCGQRQEPEKTDDPGF